MINTFDSSIQTTMTLKIHIRTIALVMGIAVAAVCAGIIL